MFTSLTQNINVLVIFFRLINQLEGFIGFSKWEARQVVLPKFTFITKKSRKKWSTVIYNIVYSEAKYPCVTSHFVIIVTLYYVLRFVITSVSLCITCHTLWYFFVTLCNNYLKIRKILFVCLNIVIIFFQKGPKGACEIFLSQFVIKTAYSFQKRQERKVPLLTDDIIVA